MLKFVTTTLFFWLATASQVFASGYTGGGGHGFGGGGGGGSGGRGSSAPEIDGPAGVAAIALVVSAGLIAYNRYKKK